MFCSVLFYFFLSCENDGLNFETFSAYFNAEFTGDQYNELRGNQFVNIQDRPISTFSIDADGASYANTRRFIQQDQMLPTKGAVRAEEHINYFNLDYDYSDATLPINLNGQISSCP